MISCLGNLIVICWEWQALDNLSLLTVIPVVVWQYTLSLSFCRHYASLIVYWSTLSHIIRACCILASCWDVDRHVGLWSCAWSLIFWHLVCQVSHTVISMNKYNLVCWSYWDVLILFRRSARLYWHCEIDAHLVIIFLFFLLNQSSCDSLSFLLLCKVLLIILIIFTTRFLALLYRSHLVISYLHLHIIRVFLMIDIIELRSHLELAFTRQYKEINNQVLWKL